MKPSETLRRNREQVKRIVAAHRARNARVFGSVLRGDDEEGKSMGSEPIDFLRLFAG